MRSQRPILALGSLALGFSPNLACAPHWLSPRVAGAVSGMVGPTLTDTFNINYVIGPKNIRTLVDIDVDGVGSVAPSAGAGVAPIVP